MMQQYWLADPCPNCGQKDEEGLYRGARLCDSNWGHDVACCSEKCGREFATKLEKSKKPAEIQRLKRRIEQLESEIREGRL